MALQDNPTLSNMKIEIDDKVSKSGDTLTGQLKFADSGYRTYADQGYSIDGAGNFKHLSSGTDNAFRILAYNGTTKFTMKYESGDMSTKGTIHADGRIDTTSLTGFKIIRDDTDSTSTSLQSSVLANFGMLDKNSNFLGILEMGQQTYGNSYVRLESRKKINNQNQGNYVTLKVDNNANRTVEFSHPAAWRSGLGFTSDTVFLSGGNDVALSTTTGSMTSVYNFNLPAGVHIVRYSVSFPPNNTGVRAISLYNNDKGEDVGYNWAVTVQAVNGSRTNIGATGVLALNTSTSFSIKALQSSGTTLNVSPRVTYHKLHDI